MASLCILWISLITKVSQATSSKARWVTFTKNHSSYVIVRPCLLGLYPKCTRWYLNKPLGLSGLYHGENYRRHAGESEEWACFLPCTVSRSTWALNAINSEPCVTIVSSLQPIIITSLSDTGSSFFWVFSAMQELFQVIIPVVFQYTTGNPEFFNVYSPVSVFGLYGFYDTNVYTLLLDSLTHQVKLSTSKSPSIPILVSFRQHWTSNHG